MRIPKDKTPNARTENDKDADELTLTGPNTELLSIRIPKRMHQELEALARQSKRQLPEVVRELLWFHAFPVNLHARLHALKQSDAEPGSERAALFYLSLLPQLQMYEHQAARLIEACERVNAVQENALALTARLKELEAEAKAEWQTFLDSTS